MFMRAATHALSSSFVFEFKKEKEEASVEVVRV